jgi:hypothetical protein
MVKHHSDRISFNRITMNPRVLPATLAALFVAAFAFVGHSASAATSASWNNPLPPGETGTIRRIEVGNYNVRYAVLTIHSDVSGFLSRMSFSFSNYQIFDPSVTVHVCSYDASGSDGVFSGCGRMIGSSGFVPDFGHDAGGIPDSNNVSNPANAVVRDFVPVDNRGLPIRVIAGMISMV